MYHGQTTDPIISLSLIFLPYRIPAIIAFDPFVSYVAYHCTDARDRRNKRHGALSILFTSSRDERDGKRAVATGCWMRWLAVSRCGKN